MQFWTYPIHSIYDYLSLNELQIQIEKEKKSLEVVIPIFVNF